MDTAKKPEPTNEKLTAALELLKRGWAIFPCIPNGKVPACAHGVKDATTDETQIRKWWSANPDCNIGLATGKKSGIYVVDIDKHGDVDGEESLRSAGVTPQATLTSRTPSGGLHLIYSSNETIRNATKLNGLAGVDVRGEGGYIVAPGSTIRGKAYAWEDPGATITEYPSALKKRPRAAAQPDLPKVEPMADPRPTTDGRPSDFERARQWLASTPASISGQGGHDRLMWAAQGVVVGFCLDDDQAKELLCGGFNARCRPAWKTKDILHKIEEARKHPIKPWGFLRDVEPPKAEALAMEIEAPQTESTEQEFLDAWRPLCDFPMPIPDKVNPNILIEGRWLERGGVSFIVSTAGTGKTTHSTQFAIAMGLGRPFSGFTPRRPLKVLVIQSEDSDDRVGIDREDIIGYLKDWVAEEDLREVGQFRVHFAGYDGKVGAEFVNALDNDLDKARRIDLLPDVVIVNPLYDRIGGDSNKGEVVTAFFAGGEINHVSSPGLRAVCRKFGIGCLVYAHTGKPPTGAELKSWIKSDMPEYQVCGSSVITNFGRSFVTLMKLPDHPGQFLLSAGKNGSGLGWKDINGEYTTKKFLCWGDGVSSCGHGAAHYWREPDEDEVVELETSVLEVKPGTSKAANDEGDERNLAWLATSVLNDIRAGVKVNNAMLRKWAEKRWTRDRGRAMTKLFEKVREKKFSIGTEPGKKGGEYVLI